MSVTSLEQCLACWRCFKNVMLSCNWERILIQELGVSVTCHVALESPSHFGGFGFSSVSWIHGWDGQKRTFQCCWNAYAFSCMFNCLPSLRPPHTHTHTHTPTPHAFPSVSKTAFCCPSALSVFHFLDQKKLHEVTNHYCPCSSAMTALAKQQ